MQISLVKKIQLDQMLFCVSIDDKYIYTGGTSKKLLRFDLKLLNQTVLTEHEKSIRCVDSKDDLVICGSYDGNVTVIHFDKIFERIDGPETEIKGVCLLNGNTKNNQIAICSRGRTSWICDFNEKIEVEAILDDHTQDIKGIKFYNGDAYSYGYDNTIKIYRKFTNYDDSWCILQSIDEISDTIWDILILDKLYAVCNDGSIYIFKWIQMWTFEKSIKISLFPLYTICAIDQNIALAIDRHNIAIFDQNLELQCVLEDAHSAEINALKYNKTNNLLVSCSDDGFLSVYNIKY